MILAAALMAVASLGGVGCGTPKQAVSGPVSPSAPTALKDQPAPDFKRPALNGAAIDTSAFRGKVLVVKFFAKYCAPCQKTLPEFKGLAERRTDAVFIGIDEDDEESDAREMIARFGLQFPVIHDVGNVLSGRFRVTEMPTTVVIGPDGTLRWMGRYDRSADDVSSVIDHVKRSGATP